MTKPNWNDAPEWAQWLAQDYVGRWMWHEEKPYTKEYIWYTPLRCYSANTDDEINENWQSTLEQRPQPELQYNVHYIDNTDCTVKFEVEYKVNDTVNHPSHYNQIAGIECIDVARHFSFSLGSAIKYIWRCYHKGATIEDLQKAVWYLQDEIKMLQEKQ